MGQPARAIALEPLEATLPVKVRELFGDKAIVFSGVTHEGARLLEIRTIMGLEEADRRMDEIYDWIIDTYPFDDTVVGLLHMKRI